MTLDLWQSNVPPEIQEIINLSRCAAIRKAAERIPPSLWMLSIEDLKTRIKTTATYVALREAFWSELGDSLLQGRGLRLKRIATKIGLSYDFTHEMLTTDAALLAWIFRSRHETNAAFRISTLAAEILSIPLPSKNTYAYTKWAETQMRTLTLLDAMRFQTK